MQNSTINPICAGCQEKIGDMPLDIYLKAIEARGEYLFCPECRKHKCDCCGWFMLDETMTKVRSYFGEYLGNACEACLHWVIGDLPNESDFPHFSTTAKPNLLDTVRGVRAPAFKELENVR